MKYALSFLIASMTLAPVLRAEPLHRELVAADAKWLVHLDLDQFRASKLGKYFTDEILGKELEKLRTETKFDANKVFSQLNSITAYGNDFKAGPEASGLLMIRTDKDTQKILEGFAAQQILQNSNGPIKKIQTEPYVLYGMNNEVFACTHPAGGVLIGKSRKQIELARAILSGKGGNLGAPKALMDFPKGRPGFLYVAISEGLVGDAAILPQAKILQMANGGRIILGEANDKLFLDLTLKGKSAEVTREIQQVIEGMLALASLSQSENQDLMQLVKATKVSGDAQSVTLGVEFPVADAIKRLATETAEKKGKKGGRKKVVIEEPADKDK